MLSVSFCLDDLLLLCPKSVFCFCEDNECSRIVRKLCDMYNFVVTVS